MRRTIFGAARLFDAELQVRQAKGIGARGTRSSGNITKPAMVATSRRRSAA